MAEECPESLALKTELRATAHTPALTFTLSGKHSEQVLSLMFRIREHFYVELGRTCTGFTQPILPIYQQQTAVV